MPKIPKTIKKNPKRNNPRKMTTDLHMSFYQKNLLVSYRFFSRILNFISIINFNLDTYWNFQKNASSCDYFTACSWGKDPDLHSN